MHGFCDASEAAYGACVYLRSIDNSGQILASLLCAKSRVAPLKSISMPRLELCGALLLAQLVKCVLNALTITIAHSYYWCDSSIVLAWLATEPAVLKTFVANRVAMIQEITEINSWRHVSSNDNAADIISRGAYPSQLQNLSLWWSGPPWLSKDQSEWPQSIHSAYLSSEIPEKRKCSKITLLTNIEPQLFTRFSSFSRLLRVTAYC